MDQFKSVLSTLGKIYIVARGRSFNTSSWAKLLKGKPVNLTCYGSPNILPNCSPYNTWPYRLSHNEQLQKKPTICTTLVCLSFDNSPILTTKSNQPSLTANQTDWHKYQRSGSYLKSSDKNAVQRKVILNKQFFSKVTLENCAPIVLFA